MQTRETLARAFVDAVRAMFPDDRRSDDEILNSPYGGYETADLIIALSESRQGGFDPDGFGRAYEIQAKQNPFRIGMAG